jgi:hypothetical protein
VTRPAAVALMALIAVVSACYGLLVIAAAGGAW